MLHMTRLRYRCLRSPGHSQCRLVQHIQGQTNHRGYTESLGYRHYLRRIPSLLANPRMQHTPLPIADCQFPRAQCNTSLCPSAHFLAHTRHCIRCSPGADRVRCQRPRHSRRTYPCIARGRAVHRSTAAQSRARAARGGAYDTFARAAAIKASAGPWLCAAVIYSSIYLSSQRSTQILEMSSRRLINKWKHSNF
jgi:hypothetical protein